MADAAARWVELEGASNVRDLGGLPLAGGGTTAYDVLYRGDTAQEWTPADEVVWHERGLALVVDLRTPGEAELEGRPSLVERGEVAYLNAPLLPDEALLPGDDGEVLVRDRDREDRVEHYLGYLRGEGARQLARAVSALAASPGPALFHCAAGKDRTGVVAALILEAAGVEREAVVADYAVTNERLDGVYARLSRRPTYAVDLAVLDWAAFAAEPATMRRFLETVEDRFGSAAACLCAVGVEPAALESLARRLRAA